LRANGKVSRGRIGVVIQEVTKELAESFGLSKAQGAAVNAVEKGGPAEKAGIEPGDVILKFDGKTDHQFRATCHASSAAPSREAR
jgi:serine protease Do